jgi:hypothetical protein
VIEILVGSILASLIICATGWILGLGFSHLMEGLIRLGDKLDSAIRGTIWPHDFQFTRRPPLPGITFVSAQFRRARRQRLSGIRHLV